MAMNKHHSPVRFRNRTAGKENDTAPGKKRMLPGKPPSDPARSGVAKAAPTVAGAVNEDTSLSALNLNWREQDLPERERTRHVHRLHPYLGKYVPQLVEIFLRKYFRPGQTVLDPFAGSGTTLVQAAELGIGSVGYDVSAFNVLLCKVKTGTYDMETVKREVTDILRRVEAMNLKAAGPTLFSPEMVPHNVPDEGNAYLQAWFAPQALSELLAFRSLIPEYQYQDLLKVILSRAARSARLTTHFDLDFPKKPQTEPYHCYKHSHTCSPATEAYKFLRRYSLDTLRRIEAFAALKTSVPVSVYHEDSRYAAIPLVDGLITSPPYVGLIDYHEQHSYAYHLLGLADNRAQEIGPAAKGAGKKAKEAYLNDMALVFKNALRSIRPGGRLIVVAGDKDNLYPTIAELAGVEQEAVVRRQVNRRTGRRAGEFYESVFIWRKRP